MGKRGGPDQRKRRRPHGGGEKPPQRTAPRERTARQQGGNRGPRAPPRGGSSLALSPSAIVARAMTPVRGLVEAAAPRTPTAGAPQPEAWESSGRERCRDKGRMREDMAGNSVSPRGPRLPGRIHRMRPCVADAEPGGRRRASRGPPGRQRDRVLNSPGEGGAYQWGAPARWGTHRRRALCQSTTEEHGRAGR